MKKMVKVMAIAASVAMLVPMAGCGNSSKGSSSGANDKDVSGKITVWGWGEGMDQLVKGFEKAYPKVKVKYTSTGTASETATGLQNAVAAGKGIPDVSMLQGTDVAQFAIGKSIDDLSAYKAEKFADDYSQGAWRKLQVEGKPFGMPIDSGPMAFFYNKAIFDKAGISDPPQTWDEYYEDAQKIHALGDQYFITNNSGNKDSYSEFNAMIWQAGANPVKVDGENLTLNLTVKDKAIKKVVDFQQKLIDEDLVNTKVGNWTDDWNRSLNDGSDASLAIGGWMPVNLENGAPDQKGNWRVAPMPQWEKGSKMGAEDGGSALVIPTKGDNKNKAAAWKFVEFETHGKGAQIMADTGTFPALKSILDSDAFKNKKDEFFGGQQVNQVLSEAAGYKVSDFTFLPYSAYAQSIYGDFIANAYSKKDKLSNALQQYQDKLVEYGNGQGYSVNK
ncbi:MULTISPECIES: extracellular solute-binding protein [unclassified Bifidobacterium]|uniref:extracellular solute-binding protein n=1 Tax=unclassified Bifidobacterium TaxID=2608897 RepID=UPI0023F7A3A2|nr:MULTISPECIES: extracellular solute-binding protein [unclassified Bifidobacterium]WEV65336.1 extracellular solute-binding protein [Bifidobacterium sp. ESL0764]WEV75861.1 extracellular solute-binding protein [Bifidobacterium sp. ESL0800]